MASTEAFLENEAELVEKAKVDDQAFSILYQHYFPKIYGYVQKRVSGRETAEDIVSQVFLKAFGHRQKYQSRGFSFGAWLYRIATNALTDHYRRQGSHLEEAITDDSAREPAGENLTEELIQKSDRQAIEKVLNKMPERYRQAVYLRYFAEMEIFEIAETLQLPKTHVSVILHRALDCFRQKADKAGIKFYLIIF
ncbi:MAG: sigma-70 family RNA polymerase sigma factor [Patescibacteria group bacterium]|nr:sigma-70 family RNA polymerase sigma factor [Patescibacteria group bacterium]